MIKIRRSGDRGHADHGWLNSHHTFSFADYADPNHMGFRHLRVINEDRVQPGRGFGMHPHRDMEIISYVVSGAMRHTDSQGHQSVIGPGEVQQMSAGTGMRHSEMNASDVEELHFLQIWIIPDTIGVSPSYQQQSFRQRQNSNTLCLIASPDGAEGSVTIHQDVTLYATRMNPNSRLEHRLAQGRHAWIQVIDGQVLIDGHVLNPGDGCALSDVPRIELKSEKDNEFLFFDLA